MPQAEPGPTWPGRIPVWWALVTLAVLVVGVAFAWRGPPGEVTSEPPRFLVGRWETDDSRYAGRALEVTPEGLIFHRGDDGPVYHGLREVRSREAEEELAVTFLYRGPEGGGDLTVYVPLDDSTTLTMQNRPDMLWRRSRP